MKEDSFWTIIKADIHRCMGTSKDSVLKKVMNCCRHESLIIVLLFRLIQKISQLNKVFMILIIPLKLILKILSIFLGIAIDSQAKIGKGLFIGHYGGIFVGAIEMGKYCNVSQQVSIGHGGRGTIRQGIPTIGDYVFIGPGAKIHGKIMIGNNVHIGPNAVVTKNIPENAIILGNPGRIVGYQEKNINLDNVEY